MWKGSDYEYNFIPATQSLNNVSEIKTVLDTMKARSLAIHTPAVKVLLMGVTQQAAKETQTERRGYKK